MSNAFHFIVIVMIAAVLSDDAVDEDFASRRREAGFRACVEGWVERISDHCKYPGQKKPCFLGTGDENAEQVDVYKVGYKCCTGNHGKCAADGIEKFCCRHADCISRCYGITFPLAANNFPRDDYEE
ncbi:hypothetical protein AAVH_01306 [Aphelenchoides avenae]|nr:hypothetical protein AAVH_01306 [Aphelenchus avenae]